MNELRTMLGVFIAVTGYGSAHAQAPDGKIPTFIESAFYKGLINRALSEVSPIILQKCPMLRSIGSNVTLLQPLVFAADGFPTAGAWKQTLPVTGCGDDVVLNFYFQATHDEKVDTLIGVPGTTRSDLVLQKDATTYVNAALVARGCGSAKVKTTRFEGFGIPDPAISDPGPGRQPRPWWETWTMVGCGRTFDLPVDFVPDEKSTQIIQPGHVVER